MEKRRSMWAMMAPTLLQGMAYVYEESYNYVRRSLNVNHNTFNAMLAGEEIDGKLLEKIWGQLLVERDSSSNPQIRELLAEWLSYYEKNVMNYVKMEAEEDTYFVPKIEYGSFIDDLTEEIQKARHEYFNVRPAIKMALDFNEKNKHRKSELLKSLNLIESRRHYILPGANSNFFKGMERSFPPHPHILN